MVMALWNDRDNDNVMRMLMYPVGGRRKIGRKGNKGDLFRRAVSNYNIIFA